jgi:hypothetical protein
MAYETAATVRIDPTTADTYRMDAVPVPKDATYHARAMRAVAVPAPPAPEMVLIDKVLFAKVAELTAAPRRGAARFARRCLAVARAILALAAVAALAAVVARMKKSAAGRAVLAVARVTVDAWRSAA